MPSEPSNVVLTGSTNAAEFGDILDKASENMRRTGAALSASPQSDRISIWRWGYAPTEYEALSTHGGDEDWVVHIPKAMRDYWMPSELGAVVDKSETSYLMGWGHVDRHELDNGDVVTIFAHA